MEAAYLNANDFFVYACDSDSIISVHAFDKLLLFSTSMFVVRLQIEPSEEKIF